MFKREWMVFLFILSTETLTTLADFSSYESDDSTMAVVNLTYVDPWNGRLHTEKSEIGMFSNGKVDATFGVLVHVRSRNGSNNMGCEYPFENLIPQNEPWIALIKRGSCSFHTKILNSVFSNATAVVVYNDRSGENDEDVLRKMSHKVPGIVAIFIAQEKGEEIAYLLANGTRVYIYITVGSYRPPRTNINRTTVLFMSISFIALMIFSLAWLVFYYVQRFRYIHAKDELARRLCNAAKKALAKIPVKNIKAGDQETSGDSECCAVCIEPYKPSDIVRTLPCKHVFHKSCVDPWLLEQRTCPMCKMDILRFYGLAYNGSQESVIQIEVDDSEMNPSGDHDYDHHFPSALVDRINLTTRVQRLIFNQIDTPPVFRVGGLPVLTESDVESYTDPGEGTSLDNEIKISGINVEESNSASNSNLTSPNSTSSVEKDCFKNTKT